MGAGESNHTEQTVLGETERHSVITTALGLPHSLCVDLNSLLTAADAVGRASFLRLSVDP